MSNVTKYVVFAVAVLVVVAIAMRIEFTKNLIFGTTTATK